MGLLNRLAVLLVLLVLTTGSWGTLCAVRVLPKQGGPFHAPGASNTTKGYNDVVPPCMRQRQPGTERCPARMTPGDFSAGPKVRRVPTMRRQARAKAHPSPCPTPGVAPGPFPCA